MAVCIAEDSVSLLRYCQTTDAMKQTDSSFETNNQQCPSSFHVNSIQMDSAQLLGNHELAKKRPLNRSHACNSKNELTRLVIGNSCSVQAVSKNNNDETSTTTRIRPTTLLLTDVAIDRPIPYLRTCFSYPLTSSSRFISIDDKDLSPAKFSSLPVITSPPTKRFRPQTLTLAPKNLSVPVLSTTVSPSISSSSFYFIDSSTLADKLKENVQIIIFDCGSPFRISRKRLKTNSSKHSIIDEKQLNECDSIILYDDHTDNFQELSAGLKCAYAEIQRCLTTKHTPIFILKCSFNQFFSLYPDLCESYVSSKNESSLSSTPISPNFDLQHYPMTHIIDGLFIGSESNARNLEELSSTQIRHIVNVTSHVPAYHSDQFNYYHISADDTQKQNLLNHFDQAYKFIHKAIENNEKVLVHCVAGISRSPAIVISFLMRYAQMNMKDAYEFVKKKRPIVSPNINFMGQLLQYETKLREQNICI
ncbi:unnamed protein product [Rotaria magnacalcarata]|uniref:Uncharacterized protein n=1 Tax=Rotaria magnacalcarata TaxID=392030 RepID=A0A815FKI8_9BILA|nr:unnamed protein product [Rotaria magnacalcarata]